MVVEAGAKRNFEIIFQNANNAAQRMDKHTYTHTRSTETPTDSQRLTVVCRLYGNILRISAAESMFAYEQKTKRQDAGGEHTIDAKYSTKI